MIQRHRFVALVMGVAFAACGRSHGSGRDDGANAAASGRSGVSGDTGAASGAAGAAGVGGTGSSGTSGSDPGGRGGGGGNAGGEAAAGSPGSGGSAAVGASDGVGGNPGGGAGGSGEAGEDGEGGMPPLRGGGYVAVAASSSFAGVFTVTASAAFWGFLDLRQCRVETYGDCVLRLCPESATQSVADAGPISIDGVGSGYAVTLLADSAGTYGNEYETLELNVGDELRVGAPGNTVPSFSAVVTMPEHLVLTEPVEPASGAALTAVRSEDLVLAWSARAAGQSVQIQASGEAVDGRSFLLLCRPDSSQGETVVPLEMLIQIPATTMVEVFATNRVPLAVGDFDIEILAASVTYTPSGRPMYLSLL